MLFLRASVLGYSPLNEAITDDSIHVKQRTVWEPLNELQKRRTYSHLPNGFRKKSVTGVKSFRPFGNRSKDVFLVSSTIYMAYVQPGNRLGTV